MSRRPVNVSLCVGTKRRVVLMEGETMVAPGESLNPHANDTCTGDCPFGLPKGHRIKDHPAFPTEPPAMTARGSSPTHEALKAEMRRALEKVAVEITRTKLGDGKEEREGALEDAYQYCKVANRCLAALDLPSLRREAAAQALEEAADMATTWANRRFANSTAEWLRARAQALREGKD